MSPLILLVEDEPSIADNIVYAFKTEGFDVVWCSTAQKAFAAFAGTSFQLVILDIGLPDISGFDLCRELRRKSSVPIIFVTARKDEIDRVVGLRDELFCAALGMELSQFFNPKGIPTSSPGLRGTSYPGKTNRRINPEVGCERTEAHTATPQPASGLMAPRQSPRVAAARRRSAATLGWRSESRWD